MTKNYAILGQLSRIYQSRALSQCYLTLAKAKSGSNSEFYFKKYEDELDREEQLTALYLLANQRSEYLKAGGIYDEM
jgi:hypothetical protein